MRPFSVEGVLKKKIGEEAIARIVSIQILNLFTYSYLYSYFHLMNNVFILSSNEHSFVS